MSMNLCFWVLMLIWAVFGVWAAWPLNAKSAGGSLLTFLLLALLGWRVFGPALHG